MHISAIKIRNLRSIEELQLSVGGKLSVIVGQNSSGKSNLFRALELFFTGQIDRRDFRAALDMPAWLIEGTAPNARTTIQVEFDLSAAGDAPVWKMVNDFYEKKSWPPPTNRRFTLVRYFSRSGTSGFQCVVPGQGTRSTEGDELLQLAHKIIRRVEYRYVPSLKDLQSQSFRDVSEELKRRLLSIWSGGGRKEITEKRERFQTIRLEIEQLIQDAASGLSQSLHEHFPEVSTIKLAMESTQLEDMIGSLDIFANDGHETLMKQKGSGVQGASIIHMLRVLRETAPKGGQNKRLFLWNIEEPETFLHPSAQRKLAALLQQQAENTQILLTTHSPLFVNRSLPKSNILFRRETIQDHCVTRHVRLQGDDPLKAVRDSLGTSLADSLALHEVVILVEGPSDVAVFKTAYERLCARGALTLPPDYIAFVSGHGASHQATSFSILKAWSPLTRLAAIFDYDRAGRDDGAKKIKGSVLERRDYFFLPHSTSDVALEELYPNRIIEEAKLNDAVAQVITISRRPSGEQIGPEEVHWNKEQLAQFFCSNAQDAEWTAIETFVQKVVTAVLK